MVFAGLAVGLQTDETDAWILVGVMSLHKVAVAFSVGFQLEVSVTKFTAALLSLFSLSIVAPFGVVIGYIVTECGGDTYEQKLVSGILQSLSVGCFLYVTFFEILCHEMYKTKERSYWKVFFIVLGFAVMVGVQFVKEPN
jgi:zinc transporter 1/2/3